MLHGCRYIYTLHETGDINVDVAKDHETRLDLPVMNQTLPKGKCANVNGLMKDELFGKTMTEFSYMAINIYLFNSKQQLKQKSKRQKTSI